MAGRLLGIGQLLRDLSGRGDNRFVRLLAGQIDSVAKGASIVRELVAGLPAEEPAAERMRDIEHEGDRFREGLVTALGSALVTPIDREDLFRVSRAIDDILDNLRDFAREWDLYAMRPAPIFGPLLDMVVDATTKLREATEALEAEPHAVGTHALAAKKAGNQVRKLYQEAMAELLDGNDAEVTTTLLKTRELLRRLDIVALRLRTAADVLSDASVKRSQ
ncbi:MAG TPA: DUF47 family protein [Candidatus Limnocylindrales bacterium]|nr:DUF47 family protein [Candidatus Limnocylindrales bacterium]